MDVQGREWEAFRSMERTIDRNRDIGILLNFGRRVFEIPVVNRWNCLNFFHRKSFEFYRSDGGSDETQLRDFSHLLNELPGNKFANLYARRDR